MKTSLKYKPTQGLHWIDNRQSIQGYVHETLCFTIYKEGEEWSEDEPASFMLSLHNILSSVFNNFDSCTFNTKADAIEAAEILIERFLQILEKPFRCIKSNKYSYFIDEMKIADIEVNAFAEAENHYNTVGLPTIKQGFRYDLSLDNFFLSFFPHYDTASFLDLAEAEAELERLRQVFIGRFV